MMEAFCTEPLRIDRGGDVRLQSASSWAGNVRPLVLRFLGFCCAEEGSDRVRDLGALLFCDGRLIMKYIAFCLRERGNSLASLVAAAHHLGKGAAFALSTLDADPLVPAAARESYMASLKLVASQLQSWSSAAPRYRPTFQQLCESGTFVPLPDILAKTLPYIESVLAAHQRIDSIAAALAVRDAAVLAAVAGDGFPNIRPRELAFLRDQQLLPARGSAHLCITAGCAFGPSCVGDFLLEAPDGSISIHMTHHKV